MGLTAGRHQGLLLPRVLDLGESQRETIVITSFADEAPLTGINHVIDWGLAGWVSRLIARGWVDRGFGDLSLLSPAPGHGYRRLLHVGLGMSSAFSPRKAERAGTLMLRTLEKQQLNSAALILPGRSLGIVSASDAYRSLLALLDAGQRRSKGGSGLDLCVLERKAAAEEIRTLRDTLLRRRRDEQLLR